VGLGLTGTMESFVTVPSGGWRTTNATLPHKAYGANCKRRLVAQKEDGVDASELASRAAPRLRVAVPTSGQDSDEQVLLDHEVGFPHPADLSWCSGPDSTTLSGGSPMLRSPAAGSPSGWTIDRTFVETLRMGSPYISAFRGTIFVIHLPGSLVDSDVFPSVMQDVCLLNAIGIRIVLVLGPGKQIAERLVQEGIEDEFADGHRVTSPRTLKIVKETAGSMMFEVEGQLARGLYNGPVVGNVRVSSGSFYSAQPIGIIDGRDFGLSGKVRRIDVEGINRRFEENDIVLLTNIGCSPSGEVFNCDSYAVASACASQLAAEKLIYFVDDEVVYDSTSNTMTPNLTLRVARSFLQAHEHTLPMPFRRALRNAITALDAGVRRAHLLNRFLDGAMLLEVFHRDGVGLMVSRDIYEGIRPARLSDLPGLIDIIEPLEAKGVLVYRPREQLEKMIPHFFVIERDGMIIACAALVPFEDRPRLAELACLAVHQSYQKSGKGAAILSFIERKAIHQGVQELLILSTQSFQWFLERGFREGRLADLPETKRKCYNYQRMSKIFLKRLGGKRSIDENDVLTRL